MVKTALLAAALLAAPAMAAAPAIRTLDGRALTPAAIDREVATLMTGAKVTGLGVALVRGGRVVFARGYGQRDAAAGLPLTADTVMPAASLTKATFAYVVLQLADEGKLDLDAPIARYLPKPLPDYPDYADLAGDPRWRKLTLRILLDHSTGFANFRRFEPDQKLKFHWDPGSNYGYSGEGVELAQFVVEHGLGLDLAAELQHRVFDRFGMTRSAMTWRDAFADNATWVYPEGDAARAMKHKRSVDTAGSLATTLHDWSAFLAGVARGDGLSPRARAAIAEPSIAIDSPAQFPTLTEARTDRWKAIRLGYGVGWGNFHTRYGQAFFKEGHDDGPSNYALCAGPRGDCILLMSNDNRAEGVFVALVERLLGPVGLPWEWENYRPYDLPATP